MTAADMLNQLAEKKQVEVENTLLKAALAQSNEGCEKLLKESNSLFQKAELNRQIESEQRLQEMQLFRQMHEKYLNEINQTVNNLKSVDQKLEQTISSQIFDFTDRIQASITAQVQFALNQVYHALPHSPRDYRPLKRNVTTNFDTSMNNSCRNMASYLPISRTNKKVF